MKDRILGGIIGLGAGDAVGVPVEFRGRDVLQRDPVTDMRGFGTYNQPPGTWSDDTSMTLCLLDSLSSGLDYTDIMEKFRLWFVEGRYTPYGEVFGVGRTTRGAITRFIGGMPALESGGDAEQDNGNGSLMRILPLVFYLQNMFGGNFFKNEAAVRIIHNVSSLTHAHKQSRIACGVYLSFAGTLLSGMRLRDAFDLAVARAWEYYEQHGEYAAELQKFRRLAGSGFKNIPEPAIKSGGYVLDTLEAAVWCLLNTDSYEECVLKAVNLGEDTDTVAAVAGGLAGIYYGIDGIPEKWKNQLAKLDYIESLCLKFALSLKTL